MTYITGLRLIRFLWYLRTLMGLLPPQSRANASKRVESSSQTADLYHKQIADF